MKVAILIDGSFFLKRYNRVVENGKDHSPEKVASNLIKFAHDHLKKDEGELFRILILLIIKQGLFS